MSARRAYLALLDGGRREEEIHVRPAGPGVYDVEVGGRVHRVDAFRHDAGTLSLLVGAESYSVQLDGLGGALKVRVGGSTHALELLDERWLRRRRGPGTFTIDGPQTITSPLPAKVVRVLAARGDAVRAGQPVVVVEALQMESELKSPRSGTLVELLVAPGQAVDGGAKLAVVE
ncbi:MAG: acetyl-CoA carboxylase biotin carboxyl carrier protein subunit [Anaeromyxobacteraceae bacterium]